METVRHAISELSRRLGVGEDEIETIEVQSLIGQEGCRGGPGVGQVERTGPGSRHRVVLSYAERVYVYETGADEPPTLCPSDEKDGGYQFMPPPGFDES